LDGLLLGTRYAKSVQIGDGEDAGIDDGLAAVGLGIRQKNRAVAGLAEPRRRNRDRRGVAVFGVRAVEDHVARVLQQAGDGELRAGIRADAGIRLQRDRAAIRVVAVDVVQGADAGEPEPAHAVAVEEQRILYIEAGAEPLRVAGEFERAGVDRGPGGARAEPAVRLNLQVAAIDDRRPGVLVVLRESHAARPDLIDGERRHILRDDRVQRQRVAGIAR